MHSALLKISQLTISRTQDNIAVIKDISISIAPGEVLALIGESGSGKTTLALSTLGWIRNGLIHNNGEVNFYQTDMVNAPESKVRKLRGDEIAYIAQSAAQSFNPRKKLNDQVIEPALIRGKYTKEQALQKAIKLYYSLELPNPKTIGNRYPHQVSGGQLQRFMIAMALILQPKLVVCDEPTSALDVTTQVGVLKALKSMITEFNTAALFVSHDLAVVTQIADRIAVMYRGDLLETDTTENILQNPENEYTKQLLSACRRWPPEQKKQENKGNNKIILQVENINAYYRSSSLFKKNITPALALESVSCNVKKGSILAIIGESGSGKSTLARVIAGLHEDFSGNLILNGGALAKGIKERSRTQLQHVQLVLQSADTALNSEHTIEKILSRVIRFYQISTPENIKAKVSELLDVVGLPKHYLTRKPKQLSGGEKQRVNLARALAAEPSVLICDEVTSALDTVVAESIIKLIEQLRDELNLGIIFISHDMATVAQLASEVMVLKSGEIVELGPVNQILFEPQKPYTKKLLDSVPELRQGWLDNVNVEAFDD